MTFGLLLLHEEGNMIYQRIGICAWETRPASLDTDLAKYRLCRWGYEGVVHELEFIVLPQS